MPRGKKKVEYSNGFKGFVNAYMTKEQREAYLKNTWAEPYDFIVEVLLKDEGYKLSLSWDSYNEAFLASITPRDEKNINFGWVLTAFAGSWENALDVLLFKHIRLYQKDWPKQPRAKEFSDFG